MINSAIVISGLGILSPIGITCDEFFQNLLNEKSVVCYEKSAYEGHGSDAFTSRIDNEHLSIIEKVIGKREYTKTEKYAIYAVKQALQDAGLDDEYLAGKRVSVILGNNDAESDVFDDYIQNQNVALFRNSSYYIAKNVSEYFGFTGASFCVHNTCASANIAVDLALTSLRTGRSDIVVVGGTDSFSLRNYTGFVSLRAVSKTGCLPFSLNRDGTIISEGAGIVILEKADDLAKRNGKAYCRVLGAGSSNDSFHLTKPDKSGIFCAIDRALADAHIHKQDVEYIMAHGTGTLTNDKIESEVIREFYNECSLKGVCSIKGSVGHMMGAAGAAALVTIGLIYKKKVLPPCSKSVPIDCQCDIKLLVHKQKDNDIGVFINHSFGFGGHNSVVVLNAY